MLHLNLESESRRGDDTHTHMHTDRGSGGGGHSSAETVYGTTHTLHHRRRCVKTQTQDASAATSAVVVNAQADVCISTVREGVSSSLFLVVIFNQHCGGLNGEVCQSGIASCLRHTDHLFLQL